MRPATPVTRLPDVITGFTHGENLSPDLKFLCKAPCIRNATCCILTRMARKSNPDNWKRPRGIALKKEMWERIDQIAERRDISVSEWVESVIARHLEAIEDSRKSDTIPQPIGSGVFG